MDHSGDGAFSVVVADRTGAAAAPGLSDADDLRVRAVESVAAAVDRLSDGHVDCVVTAEDLPDGTGIDLAEAVRERDPDLPVVLYPRDGTADLAAAASAIEGVRYLPRSADDRRQTLLAERVRDAAEAYERRRDRRRDARLFEFLLEHSPVPVFFKDREGRYVRVSESTHADWKGDPIGRTDPEIAQDEELPYARDALETDLEVVETGEAIVDRRETMFDHIDDIDTVYRRTTRIPWRDEDGEVLGLFGMQFDDTDRHRLERDLARCRRRLDRIADFTAHDLRNPLNLARGYVEHALDTGDEQPLRGGLDALDRMEAMIDQLLASLRTEVPEPITESVPLAAIARDAWEAVGPDDGTLRVEFDGGAVVRADRSHLRTFFVQLFENAVAHAGEDATVGLSLLENGFAVEDDGPGIPEPERESVLQSGYTDAEGGTGIGLSTVAEIANRHGWELSVAEGNGGGTRFEVRGCLLVASPRPGLADGGTSVPLSAACDFGGAEPPGTSRYVEACDEWVLRAGGRNVWHHTDEGHFRYATVSGDARIVGRVLEIDEAADFSKGALVVRSAAAAGEPMGGIGYTATGQSEVLWQERRNEPIETTQLTSELPLPHWYRVDRAGDRVVCYRSEDGEEWVPIDQRSVDLDETIAVGVLASGLSRVRPCTVRFDGVAVTDR